MVEMYGLKEVQLPEDRHVESQYHSMPKCNIFMSEEFRVPNVQDNQAKRRALVLIQGSGAVRAGIWARSVCVNQDLELGSMLPFVDKCHELEIPVLVMNPNFNRDEHGVKIPFSGQHATYVWEKYIKDSGFTEVSVVAHSAGGGHLQQVQSTYADTFYDQVSSIAYTDSWVISKASLDTSQSDFMFQNAKHYKASN